MKKGRFLKEKRIAIVDYGEAATVGRTALITLNGKDLPGIGIATTRYGLNGINYGPGTHMVPFQALREGKTDLGRNHAGQNYGLGISPQQDGNELISKQHATVELTKDGKIIVQDNSSTNGTKVLIPPQTM